MRTAMIIATCLWLAVSASANAKAIFVWVPEDSTIRVNKATTVGNFVQFLNGRYPGINLNTDSIVELNQLANKQSSGDNVAIETGSVIKLTVAAAKKIAAIKSSTVEKTAVKKQPRMTASEIEGLKPGPMHWRHFGIDPLEPGYWEIAWSKMSFSQMTGVMKVFKEKFNKGEYVRDTLRAGDQLIEMSGGKAHIYGTGRGIVVDPEDPSLVLYGNAYLIDLTDKILEIFNPDTCNNFCTRWKNRPVQAVIASPPSTRIDTIFKPAPTPAPKDSVTPKPAPIVNTAPAEDTASHNHNSVYLFGGAGIPAHRPPFEWDDQVATGGGLWECLWQKGQARSSYGFALKFDVWSGNDTTQTNFWGGEFGVGPMAMISLTPQIWWGIEPVALGGKFAWTNKPPKKLNHSYQTNLTLSHVQTLKTFFDFGQMGLWFEGDYAPMSLTHRESWKKGFHTYQGGIKSANPDTLDTKENNSAIQGEIKFIFGPDWTAKPVIFGRTCYTFDNRIPRTNSLGAGLAFGQGGAFQVLGMLENGYTRYHPKVNTVKLWIDCSLGWMAGPWNCKKNTWE